MVFVRWLLVLSRRRIHKVQHVKYESEMKGAFSINDDIYPNDSNIYITVQSGRGKGLAGVQRRAQSSTTGILLSFEAIRIYGV